MAGFEVNASVSVPGVASPDNHAEARTSSRRQRGEKMCYNCMQTGHIAKDCSNPRVEGEAREKLNKERAKYRKCFNCGKVGHISADCTKPANNNACYNCGLEGHIAKECPNPRATE